MKTVWDQKTIWRKSQPEWQWIREKQLSFESQTGVKWTYFPAQGKHKFMPTWDLSEERKNNLDVQEILLSLVRTRAADAKTFLQAHQESGIDLDELMGTVKYLCKVGKAVPVVGRNGRAIAYYGRN